MKRIITAVLALSLTLSLQAQGIKMLDKVKDSRAAFHYTYSLSRGGGEFTSVTDGDVTVEDNCYVMDGLGIKVTSNGEIRLSVDPDAREAVVEKVEKEDIFTNPALFIGSYKNYLDRITVNSSDKTSMDVTLTLDEDTKARFVLTGIKFSPKEGKSDFTVDVKSLPEDYLVTDLR